MKRIVQLGQIISILISIIVTLSCTSAPPREPAQVENEAEISRNSVIKASVPNGPYDDCDQRGLFNQSEKFTWVCTDNYVHIYPTKPVVYRPTSKLKIGAFNVYHLGDDQARLKDHSAMALIMNQWDVVGASEMMPLPMAYADENRKLRDVMKSNQQKIPSDWRVVEPGYYKLLKALQEKDASWALIFQPMPEGEGTAGEMAGFFYRGRKVQLRMWDYCPRSGLADKINPNVMGLNFGCLAQVPEAKAKLMSRRAFTTAFKSGKFDFIGAVAHTRFRPASAADQSEQLREICQNYSTGVQCSIPKDKVGRFYEIKAVVDEFPKFEKFDQDIIYMGDFNLDYSDLNRPAWAAALSASEGYDVYQQANTSLSLPMQTLANSYDHFIIRQYALKECDFSSIRAYDFTQIGSENLDSVRRKLAYLLTETNHAKTDREQKAFLEKQIRLEKTKNLYHARALTEEEKARLANDIQRSIVRLKNNKFWVLREYLSDHVPIEMTCNTKTDDD